MSDRAKQVLEQLSETDFQFLSLDTEVDAGQEPAPLWLCEVMPMLDPVDEARSYVRIEQSDARTPIYQITPSMKLCFDEACVGSHHAFRLTKNFATIICDDAFKTAVKEAKLTGLRYQDVTMS